MADLTEISKTTIKQKDNQNVCKLYVTKNPSKMVVLLDEFYHALYFMFLFYNFSAVTYCAILIQFQSVN